MSEMPKLIHFVRIQQGDYHPFSLCHYLCIKSFYDLNGSVEINLWVNREFYDRVWYIQLKADCPNIKVHIVDDSDIDKYKTINNFVDHLYLKILYEHGGMYLDMDHICLTSIVELFDGNPIYVTEVDRDNDKPVMLSSTTVVPPKFEFIKEVEENYKNYDKDKVQWAEFLGEFPLSILPKYRDKVTVYPDQLFNPYSYTRKELAHIFLHNRNLDGAIMLHFSESLAWDRYLKPMDLEHVMTVDTTFTKACRRFVSHLWNSERNEPKFIHLR